MATKPIKDDACKMYFMVVEHDIETSNLNMTGLTEPQRNWWTKHRANEFRGICHIDGNRSGERVTVETADEPYIDGIVGSSPLYSIAWGEERIFVPDKNGGHYAWSAHGILSIYSAAANAGKGDFVSIAPVHDTNHTVFSSSALSLLKEALAEIRKRSTELSVGSK